MVLERGWEILQGGGGFFIEWREFEEGGVILIIEPFSKIKTFLFRQLMTS